MMESNDITYEHLSSKDGPGRDRNTQRGNASIPDVPPSVVGPDPNILPNGNNAERNEFQAPLAETVRMAREIETLKRRIAFAQRSVARASSPRGSLPRADAARVNADIGRPFDHIGESRRPQPQSLPYFDHPSFIARGPFVDLDRPSPPKLTPDHSKPAVPGPGDAVDRVQTAKQTGPEDSLVSMAIAAQGANRSVSHGGIAATGVGQTGALKLSKILARARNAVGVGVTALVAAPTILAALMLAASTTKVNGDKVDKSHELDDGSNVRITGLGSTVQRDITIADPFGSVLKLIASEPETGKFIIEGGTVDNVVLHPTELNALVNRINRSRVDGLTVSLSEEVDRKIGKGHNGGPPLEEDGDEDKKRKVGGEAGGQIGIGHNGGPSIDNDDVEQKRKKPNGPRSSPPVINFDVRSNSDSEPESERTVYSGGVYKSNKADPSADLLAERLKGFSRGIFKNDPKRQEFDAISDRYIAQTKPSSLTLGSKFRKQAKDTFKAAQETGREAYFHFDGRPRHASQFERKLNEYGKRYGVKFKIDFDPF